MHLLHKTVWYNQYPPILQAHCQYYMPGMKKRKGPYQYKEKINKGKNKAKQLCLITMYLNSCCEDNFKQDIHVLQICLLYFSLLTSLLSSVEASLTVNIVVLFMKKERASSGTLQNEKASLWFDPILELQISVALPVM